MRPSATIWTAFPPDRPAEARHASRQRQIVRRIVEKGIPGNFYYVIVNVGMRAGEPTGLSVGNEVNFVTTLGEFESEFGGDNTTATISGITSDPDLHVAGLSLQSRLFTFDGINAASIQISEWKWGICLRVGGWSGGRL